MQLFDRIKGFFMNLFGFYPIEKSIGIDFNISGGMREKIKLWNDMYFHCAPWHDKAPPCGIESTVSGMLSTAIGEEIKLSCQNEQIEPVLKRLNDENYKITQCLVSIGGCVVRPVFANGKLQYETIQLGNYLPLSYDFDGTLTAAVITKKISEGKRSYLLAEKHEYKGNAHRVELKLFEVNNSTLKPVPLDTCAQTAELTPEFTWQNVERPFIVEFRNRVVNTVDGSNVPVSMFCGHEDLIQDADEQYARMKWEQEGGELKVFADMDLFRKRQGDGGNQESVKLDSKLQKLFVKLNGDSQPDGQKITTHSPTLRTEQQKAAFQEILKRIEQAVNIGKGSLSDLESVQKTATQFLGGKKAFYSVVDTFESELEQKYKHCAYVFAYMAAAYLGGAMDDEITVEYDDMTRKDPAQVKQMALQEIGAGVMDKWEYRQQFYGETEEEARERVPQTEAPPMFGGF